MSSQNSRRQFLRTTTIATLSAGLIPNLLKAENHSAAKVDEDCFPTTLDYYGQGPFYTANAPDITANKLAADTEPGTRLIVSGVIRTIDCTEIIPNTLIDAWHANDSGAYDSTGFNLRGKTFSNVQGFYMFETIRPGKYLNGSLYRPSHIHFKITPPGFPTITTQLYFQGDTDIPADAAASLTSGTYDASHRIIPLTLNAQGKMEGTWDIIVNGDGTTGMNEIHLDKGMIYSVSPNPYSNTLQINYGIFQEAKVSLQVFDMRGALVAILDEKQLTPQKYNAEWDSSNVAPGTYWVSLKINDMQVHYQKVVKE